MGRRSRPPRPSRVMWILVLLALATFLNSAQAGSEPPQFVTQAHEEKPFRIDVPEGWSVEWDYPVGRNRVADMVAFGPLEGSYQTNVGVDSKFAVVTESDDYLMEASQEVINDVRRIEAVTVLRPPALVETANSRAAVFVLAYDSLPVTQVVAVVASRSLERIWFIVGTSAVETAETNEPIFNAVIASFEVLTGPEPAFIDPVGSSLLTAAIAGSAALLGGWVLYRRRHEVVTLLRTIRDEGQIPSQIESRGQGRDEADSSTDGSEGTL